MLFIPSKHLAKNYIKTLFDLFSFKDILKKDKENSRQKCPNNHTQEK